MGKIISSLRLAAIFGVFAVCIGLTVPEANGQGTRRKRNPVKTPVYLPVVPAGEAQIISRAEDFPDPDAQVLPKTDEKKAETVPADPDENSRIIADLRNRISGLESAKKNDSDEKQKRLLLNLDILNRAEQRSESLRKQLFEMIEKESTIKTKLDLIEMSVRPEAIEREVSLAGSLRPEDLRALKKKQLEVERTNLQSILAEIQRTKLTLEQNLNRSDAMVEKLRVKLEKEIDDALADDPSKP
jgi:hypothetical protein